MRLYTGTSGFSYGEWHGPFYPDDLPASGRLGYYAGRLSAVEINNTFYRMPTAPQLEKWAADTPEEFRFVLKMARRVTHLSRLRDVADPVGYFFRAAGALGGRLGPTLVQLPPYLRKDLARLEAFLDLVPADRRVALEFRHESWIDGEVHAALRARGAALCLADGEDGEPAMTSTAPWGYLRLRRPGYDDAALRAWADRLAASGWNEAYVFFKHEDEGAGPHLAARFAELASG